MHSHWSSLAEYTRKLSFLRQVVKFSIVGGVAAIVNFSIYFSLTHFGGVWYVYSAIAAYLLAAVCNFIANKMWTFRNPHMGRHVVNQVTRFTVVTALGLLGNTAIIYFLTDMRSIDYRISWVIATIVVAVWNFSFNRLWTFRSLPSAQLS